MLRFSIRHLLIVTTVASMAFAVGRLLDYVSILMLFAIAAVLAPIICYCIAAVFAANSRSVRQIVRRLLLAVTVFLLAAAWMFIHGAHSLAPLIASISVMWIPQWVLLKLCSSYRSELVGTGF